MPTIKSLDEAAQMTGVPRRTLQRWLRQEKLTPWSIEGDPRRFVDIDEIRRLREPRPLRPPRTPAAVGGAEPLVANAIIVKGDRILMVRRRFTEETLEWSSPSGECDPGETPEEAAVREVAEEVGLEIAVDRKLGERIHPATGRHLVYLACRVLSGEAQVIDHEEIAEVAWCGLAEVGERLSGLKGGLFPPVREYMLTLAGTEAG